jgi:hypothetical protein
MMKPKGVEFMREMDQTLFKDYHAARDFLASLAEKHSITDLPETVSLERKYERPGYFLTGYHHGLKISGTVTDQLQFTKGIISVGDAFHNSTYYVNEEGTVTEGPTYADNYKPEDSVSIRYFLKPENPSSLKGSDVANYSSDGKLIHVKSTRADQWATLSVTPSGGLIFEQQTNQRGEIGIKSYDLVHEEYTDAMKLTHHRKEHYDHASGRRTQEVYRPKGKTREAVDFEM